MLENMRLEFSIIFSFILNIFLIRFLSFYWGFFGGKYIAANQSSHLMLETRSDSTLTCEKTNEKCFLHIRPSCPSSEGFLTVPAHHHRRGRAEHGGVGHHVSHCAGVVAGVRGLHLGDVEVARLLGDEAPGVLPQEASLPVYHPVELHLWKGSCFRVKQTKL